jgi:hypothetical protein
MLLPRFSTYRTLGLHEVVPALLDLFLSRGLHAATAAPLQGTVCGPEGVAGAAIQARNIETGVVYPAQTSNTGNHTIAQLPAGAYGVTMAVAGFKKYVRAGPRVH